MANEPKKPLIDKLLIIGALVTFITVTILFSPMLLMATVLAGLPMVAMVILITPTLHLNILERQTESNREK
ncbi:MAG TPA: hypothetical protein PLY93_13255 [Turneriella sp.]|nr:hypothetical protein [Turneriella sp.]